MIKTDEELSEFEKHVSAICTLCAEEQLDGTCEGCIVDTLYDIERERVYDNYEDRKRHD